MVAEDEMVGWHPQLNGHAFVQAPGDSEGQGSLVCCSPWNREELDTTEQLTSNNLDDSEPWPELKLLGHSLCSLSPETVISETPAQDLIRS